jgi:hypothetical protein
LLSASNPKFLGKIVNHVRMKRRSSGCGVIEAAPIHAILVKVDLVIGFSLELVLSRLLGLVIESENLQTSKCCKRMSFSEVEFESSHALRRQWVFPSRFVLLRVQRYVFYKFL